MLKIEDDELEAFLLKLDQEKAFDRVGHDYFPADNSTSN
jgi:hypothetical protein